MCCCCCCCSIKQQNSSQQTRRQSEFQISERKVMKKTVSFEYDLPNEMHRFLHRRRKLREEREGYKTRSSSFCCCSRRHRERERKSALCVFVYIICVVVKKKEWRWMRSACVCRFLPANFGCCFEKKNHRFFCLAPATSQKKREKGQEREERSILEKSLQF